MAHRRWRVTGIDRESGFETELVVEAADRGDAVIRAGRQGVQVAAVRRVRRPLPAGAKIVIAIAAAVVLLYGSLGAGYLWLGGNDDRPAAAQREPRRPVRLPAAERQAAMEAAAKRGGLGWSLADVQAQWGEARGWEWLFPDAAVNALAPDTVLMTWGDADNLASVSVMVLLPPGADTMAFATQTGGAMLVMGTLLEADPHDLSDWLGESLRARRADRRQFERRFGKGGVVLLVSDNDDGGMTLTFAAVP